MNRTSMDYLADRMRYQETLRSTRQQQQMRAKRTDNADDGLDNALFTAWANILAGHVIG